MLHTARELAIYSGLPPASFSTCCCGGTPLEPSCLGEWPGCLEKPRPETTWLIDGLHKGRSSKDQNIACRFLTVLENESAQRRFATFGRVMRVKPILLMWPDICDDAIACISIWHVPTRLVPFSVLDSCTPEPQICWAFLVDLQDLLLRNRTIRDNVPADVAHPAMTYRLQTVK